MITVLFVSKADLSKEIGLELEFDTESEIEFETQSDFILPKENEFVDFASWNAPRKIYKIVHSINSESGTQLITFYCK